MVNTSKINRLKVLEKRAEIAQIREVLRLRQAPVFNLLINRSNTSLEDLAERLIRAEDYLISIHPKVLKLERGDAYRKCT